VGRDLWHIPPLTREEGRANVSRFSLRGLYTNRLISGWSWDRTDYTVILKDGHVVEYGPGQVRQREPNTGVLILVPTQ
jgi:hypothetical protein